MWNNVQEKLLLRKASKEIRKSTIPTQSRRSRLCPIPCVPQHQHSSPHTASIPHPYSAAMGPFGFLLSPGSSFRSPLRCGLTRWSVAHCCLFVSASCFVGLLIDRVSPPQDLSSRSQDFAFSLSAQHGHGTLLKLINCKNE